MLLFSPKYCIIRQKIWGGGNVSTAFSYTSPGFDFSAPVGLVKRMERNVTENQEYRTGFMRDRDRVLYSSAFRRLSGKTQIYLTGKDDHQRNRLTHTLEVSQIARTISHALKLNCDLTEAIALAHDLGHTPFGHAGEQILHEIMVPDSPIEIKKSPMNANELAASEEIKMPLFGFKHNVQSVRIAASLETNYEKMGLNLTNFTLWGILHHSSIKYKSERVNSPVLVPTYKDQYQEYMQLPGDALNDAWSFEAFVVAQADEIAQWHHDLEDALRGNAMTCIEVCSTIERNLSTILPSDDAKRLKALKKKTQADKKYISDLARIVVNTLVNRLIECSLHNLRLLWDEYIGDTDTANKKRQFFKNHRWDEPDIQNAISFKKKGENDKKFSFQSVISEKIHHSRDVERMNAKGKYIIRKLFQAYYSNPQQLPDGIIKQYMVDVGQYSSFARANTASIGIVRIKFEKYISSKNFSIKDKIILMRKICDHIAGMTDHYAIEEYEQLYG